MSTHSRTLFTRFLPGRNTPLRVYLRKPSQVRRWISLDSFCISWTADSYRPETNFSSSWYIFLMNLTFISTSSVPKAAAVCAGFGQPGWAPFCFLNGNPVFNAFDVFQAFIQSSIVSLHNVLQVKSATIAALRYTKAVSFHKHPICSYISILAIVLTIHHHISLLRRALVWRMHMDPASFCSRSWLEYLYSL